MKTIQEIMAMQNNETITAVKLKILQIGTVRSGANADGTNWSIQGLTVADDSGLSIHINLKNRQPFDGRIGETYVFESSPSKNFGFTGLRLVIYKGARQITATATAIITPEQVWLLKQAKVAQNTNPVGLPPGTGIPVVASSIPTAEPFVYEIPDDVKKKIDDNTMLIVRQVAAKIACEMLKPLKMETYDADIETFFDLTNDIEKIITKEYRKKSDYTDTEDIGF